VKSREGVKQLPCKGKTKVGGQGETPVGSGNGEERTPKADGEETLVSPGGKGAALGPLDDKDQART